MLSRILIITYEQHAGAPVIKIATRRAAVVPNDFFNHRCSLRSCIHRQSPYTDIEVKSQRIVLAVTLKDAVIVISCITRYLTQRIIFVYRNEIFAHVGVNAATVKGAITHQQQVAKRGSA